MDIATIIGLFGGSALVLSAILMGGSAVVFINLPGLLIVVGGTLAATFIKFSLSDVINSIAVGMKAFIYKIERPDDIIQQMVEYTRIAKKEGLISLEKVETKDKFSAKALQYLSDGFDEGLIEDMLNKDINLTIQRHTTGQNVFKGMGAAAPAFGMIGTLIGLVQMLANMADPQSIGPKMAVALLTTFYGAVLANVLFLPMAGKLKRLTEIEVVTNQIITEGIVGIQTGAAPTVLENKLKSFLETDRQQDKLVKKQSAQPA